MAYVAVLLATRWGSELGGINVFNTGLASAISDALPKKSRTICFVEELPPLVVRQATRIEFELLITDAKQLADRIATFCDGDMGYSMHGVLVVGHDVITGGLAVACTDILKTKLVSISVQSAVVSHMDYSEYSRQKGTPLEEVMERHRHQQQVISSADHAFAVGPLLAANFSTARSSRGKTAIRKLHPGASKITPVPLSSRVGLQFFISGRLNSGDDPIKNGVLAVHSLARAYEHGRKAHQDNYRSRGKLFACGVDTVEDADLIGSLRAFGQSSAMFEMEPVPFTNDQAKIHEYLAESDIALMPSWHEGFGLSGWEALCAGVPLICSAQSGLAMFLGELKADRPDLPLESVEFVNLGGSVVPGIPSPEDIEIMAGALKRIVETLPTRKNAALTLARELKIVFTWSNCADDFLGEIDGWHLSGSVKWYTRQRVAKDAARAASPPESAAEVLDRVVQRFPTLVVDHDWGDLTTAFNYLSDVGKTDHAIARRSRREQLKKIGVAVESALIKQPLRSSVRATGCMDVCWRYMAACSAMADSFSEFAELHPPKMLDIVWGDSFLRREMLYYASRFAGEFGCEAASLVTDFFMPISKLLDCDPTLVTRIARLSSSSPGMALIIERLPDRVDFQNEAARCRVVADQAHDIAAHAARDPSLISTILALMALQKDPVRQVADQTIAFIRAYFQNAGDIDGHWRGDKRLFAALATANLATSEVIEALGHMAVDEDESIRWAALHLSFSSTLRRRLEASLRSGTLKIQVPLNQALGQIVDAAVSTNAGHPWLCREFLAHFRGEWGKQPATNDLKKLTILDFPICRWLLGPVIGEAEPKLEGARHPEVKYERDLCQQSIRRVLLVLPPIESGAVTEGASRTSTPALGLGLLAAHLASKGHDVQVADCHRFPTLGSEVVRLAPTYDVIGLNVVFTTVRSTIQLLNRIRECSLRPLLVVGGPAVKLNTWKSSVAQFEEARNCWDFAIAQQDIDNLLLLVDSRYLDSPWPKSPGLLANLDSSALAFRDIANEVTHPTGQVGMQIWEDWSGVELDRRIFGSLEGQYEPARTRSLSPEIYEAHIVMSQGCDWDCVFCTERKTVSGGERRRSVKSVLPEIFNLTKQHDQLNIQFVDDNLLPQLATIDPQDWRSRGAALAWANEFFNGLEAIRRSSRGSFGWRGIFRFEDFFAYEKELGAEKFLQALSNSGCRMLAFGVEHGDAERRMKIKAGDCAIENIDIANLFGRLRKVDILSKAYFILGGPWESPESASQSVKFAIESGVTLAYFALYKDFTGAVKALSRVGANGDELAKKYLSYSQLTVRWDEYFSREGNERAKDESGDNALHAPASEEEVTVYRQLARMGFRFSDIVKYNDFHSNDGPSGELLRKVTWNLPDDYFFAVEKAYREFYLRQSFVSDYELLLKHGY